MSHLHHQIDTLGKEKQRLKREKEGPQLRPHGDPRAAAILQNAMVVLEDLASAGLLWGDPSANSAQLCRAEPPTFGAGDVVTDLPSRSFAVDLHKDGCSPTTGGTLTLRYWTPKDAWQRAFLFFSVVYLFGGFSLASPVVHFVIPPLWIFVAPYLAQKIYRSLNGKTDLRRGHGTCPECSQEIPILPAGRDLPFTVSCRKCSAAIDVTPRDPDAVARIAAELEARFRPSDASISRFLPSSWTKAQLMDQSWMVLIYLALIACSILVFWFVAIVGQGILEPSVASGTGASVRSQRLDLLGQFLLALVAIMVAAKLFGRMFARIKQPPVMGEVIAGIVLGPSVLGALSPRLGAALFPPTLTPALSGLAQIGIVIFMFLVGVELDTKLLRNKVHASVAISHVSIIVPFLAGSVLALFLYSRFAPPGTPFLVFSMFIGTALSVTAFPVLARIIKDLKLTHSALGSVALTCAAVDDITAWCLLAAVTGIAAADVAKGFVTLGLSLVFVCFMLSYGKRMIVRLAQKVEEGAINTNRIATVLLLAFGAALITEWIGIHALFGAFLVGALIPKDSKLSKALGPRLGTVVVTVLLPIFFAYSGLRVQLHLLDTPADWLWCVAVILVASVAKVGGAAVAAMLNGFTPREAVGIGLLMNTRGLMELVVLNIGLDLGVITPRLFTIMVIMAIVTTLATTPLFCRLTKLRTWAPVPNSSPPIPIQ